MATLPGHKALHAVRIVLRNFPTRPPSNHIRNFSVAVLPNYSQYPSLPSSSSSSSATRAVSLGPRHASSDYEGLSDFLEDDTASTEYDTIASGLVTRVSAETPHWATLFPNTNPTTADPVTPIASSSTTSTPERVRACDTLANHVAAGEFNLARELYAELTALGVWIMPRAIYLNAALSSLDETEAGKRAFMMWLELVPNRPAVRVHPGVKAIWQPVVDRLICDFTMDRQLTADYLDLMARKGILPAVLGPIMRHLTLFNPTNELTIMMHDLTATYKRSTTSLASTSRRAQAQEVFANRRVDGMWNSYARALAAAQRHRAVQRLLKNPEMQVQWTQYTLAYIEERRAGIKEIDTSASQVVAASTEIGQAASSESETTSSIVSRFRKAKSGAVSPTALADLMQNLEEDAREGLVKRLNGRLLERGGYQRELAVHAEMLIARRKGSGDEEVVRSFDRNFLWVGLPRPSIASIAKQPGLQQISAGVNEDEGSSLGARTIPTPDRSSSPRLQSKLYPSRGLITSLIPCLLPLLPPPLTSSIPSFHQQYLSGLPALSPRLQPSPITHFVFIRTIAHLLGPAAAIGALRNMVDHGIQPRLEEWHTVLWSMAGKGQTEALEAMLRQMRDGVAVRDVLGDGTAEQGSAWTMPQPTSTTYKSIAGILKRAGKEVEAAELNQRVRRESAMRLQEERVGSVSRRTGRDGGVRGGEWMKDRHEHRGGWLVGAKEQAVIAGTESQVKLNRDMMVSGKM